MSTRRHFLAQAVAAGAVASSVSSFRKAAAAERTGKPEAADRAATAHELAGLRARLHKPGPLFFAQTMFPEPGLSSILGSCRFDYVMVDMEHGPFTLTSLRACVEALNSTRTPVIVRTASQSEVEIKQVLDLGVDGVMIPRIESVEEATAAVRAARYAPEGIRGVSRAVRAARFGLDETYVANANSRVAVMVIIESGRGVENVEKIVAVPGLDGIMIGADDLSADLGLFGQYDHPRLRHAIKKITDCAISAGLKVSGQPRTPQERESMLIGCLNDAIMYRTAAQQALATQRAAVPTS
jgi:4-hydroxy-2-oxoheptanedioate aldolase